MTDKWQWWAGNNDEYYTSGPFETRDEAIDALGGDGGYIIEAVKHVVEFSADMLICSQYWEQDDLFDYDHGEPERRGDHIRADAELQSLLNDWTTRHQNTFAPPNLFKATRNAEYIKPSWESK